MGKVWSSDPAEREAQDEALAISDPDFFIQVK